MDEGYGWMRDMDGWMDEWMNVSLALSLIRF